MLWVVKPPLFGAESTARTAVQDDCRLTVALTKLLVIDLMTVANREVATVPRLYNIRSS